MESLSGWVASSIVSVAAEAAAQTQRAALRLYPEEACGLLLGRWLPAGGIEVERAVETCNVAPLADRKHRFTISPRALLDWDRAAASEGLSIVGFFHSHPDASAQPSVEDAAHAWPGYAYLILSTTGRPGGAPAIVSGIAAWTFDDPTRSFRESTLDVRVAADDGIDYVI